MIVRQKRILLLGIAVALVVGLSLTGVLVLIRGHQTAIAAASNPQGTGNQPFISGKMSGDYTFEDGGTDGWMGKGHIVSVANSQAQAHDGRHALQIIFYSSSPSDQPFVSVPVGTRGPETGEELTAYLYLSGATKVQAQLYVQDSNNQWRLNSWVSLVSGKWTKLSLTLPTLSSAVAALGVQFLATPANKDATVHLDSVSWGFPIGSTPVTRPSGGGVNSPTPTSGSGGSSPAPASGGGSPPRPQPTPTPTSQPASGGNGSYSFEDGGLDGWSSNGHIPSFINSTAIAHNGSHSLRVEVYSTSSGDMPFLYAPLSSGEPVTGETLTMYLYLAPGSAAVQVQSYVQDGDYQWHVSNWVNLVSGGWTEVALTVPRISVTALGVQFLVTPANKDATVYLDGVSW